MLTACNGTYERHPDGWRYAWGDPVPGAEDMTISTLYNLPCARYGDGTSYVIVPASLARNEPELAWCLDSAVGPARDFGRERGFGRDPNIPDDAMYVPLAEWDERAKEPIGVWAPELHPDRLLDTRAVAERAGVSADTVRSYLSRGSMPGPQGHLMGSPWWTVPVIDRWLATRRGPGRPRVAG